MSVRVDGDDATARPHAPSDCDDIPRMTSASNTSNARPFASSIIDFLTTDHVTPRPDCLDLYPTQCCHGKMVRNLSGS